MKTAVMKLADIRPAAYNPRITLKPGDNEYEALKNSLERFGVAAPLIVNETTGNLISGHQRLNVLKAAGAEEVEVVLVELDAAKEKLLNIALNKIDGDWDYVKLEALFSEFSDEDIKFTGFTEEDLQNMFDREMVDFESQAEENSNVSSGSGEENSTGEEQEENTAAVAKEFNVFLSFPTKELAEKWLHDRGVALEYAGSARNITIRMEGLDYGTGN